MDSLCSGSSGTNPAQGEEPVFKMDKNENKQERAAFAGEEPAFFRKNFRNREIFGF